MPTHGTIVVRSSESCLSVASTFVAGEVILVSGHGMDGESSQVLQSEPQGVVPF